MLNDEFSKHGPLDTVRLLGRDTDGSYFGYACTLRCTGFVTAVPWKLLQWILFHVTSGTSLSMHRGQYI